MKIPDFFKGSSHWSGNWRDGSGSISTDSKSLDQVDYSYETRFGQPHAAGPEELLAAAHAACINQAIANVLNQAGFTAISLDTSVEIELAKDEHDKMQLKGSHIKVVAEIAGIVQSQFEEAITKAKNGCTISRALSIPVTIEGKLNH